LESRAGAGLSDRSVAEIVNARAALISSAASAPQNRARMRAAKAVRVPTRAYGLGRDAGDLHERRPGSRVCHQAIRAGIAPKHSGPISDR
jgi:hypothetical protein